MTQPYPSLEKPKKVFYGWWIVAVAFMSNFMATGTGFYVFNVFIKELQVRFGWEEGSLSWAFMTFILVTASYQVILGRLIPRFGVRTMMLFGSGLAGAAYLLLSRMNALWQFYILVGVVLAVGNASQSGVTSNTIVTRWFLWKRGKALGIATSGISLSGVLLPLLVSVLLPYLGLENTFTLVGLLIWIVIWPLVVSLVREYPEDMGLKPDGMEVSQEDDTKKRVIKETEHAEWTATGALKTSAFWKISLSYSFALMAVTGVMMRVVPHFMDVGYTTDQASMILAGTALMGTLGKVAWGWFCDRFEIRRVIATLFFMKAVGLIILILYQSPLGAIIFIFMYGFPMGGVLATLPAILARTFGSRSFSIVAGTLGPFLIFQSFGHPIMGYSADLAGSYNPAYIIFIIGLIGACVLTLSIRFPLAKKASTADIEISGD
jgi:OFA family oxalate/formate antiporter-like MFS transporter